nr:MAG TPA: hypothetical protein [Caudoviricetes sp.]
MYNVNIHLFLLYFVFYINIFYSFIEKYGIFIDFHVT